MEVLWTRMFQQVLQDSVYTFSIILVTFLAALSAGAFLLSTSVTTLAGLTAYRGNATTRHVFMVASSGSWPGKAL